MVPPEKGNDVNDLLSQYRRVIGEPSDIQGHLESFVEMVLHTDAKVVIELGTRTGVSTIAWLHGLSQTGGHLWSVDIDEVPPIGEYPNWTFIQGDDLDPVIVARLPRPADIVFIDTSHLYDQTVAEIELYQHLVRPGGLMVFHDTELARPEGAPARPMYPVRVAVQEYAAAEGRQWHNATHCNGLGIIQM